MFARCINIKKVAASVTLGLLLTVAVAGCSFSKTTIYTSGIFAMDTVMEFQVAGEEDYTPQVASWIQDLEKELSVTDENSEIYRLNHYKEDYLSPQVAEIMSGALKVCERTEGALDITIYPVLRTWGFTTDDYRVPTDWELEELLKGVDYSKCEVADAGEGAEKVMVSIPEEALVDLGSVAKGYTGTYVADRLRDLGVTHALLNLGGNVQCIGRKPDGQPWKVAVKSPFEDSSTGMLGVIDADDVAIITSGGYERYFEEDGVTYWHILDPSTGKPARNGLVSVTIIGKDGLLCDGLSTGLFVKGLEEATRIWRESDDFEAVFVTEDREVYVTEGVAGIFSLTPEYQGTPLHVINR
jgi:thiamine biosynthesis lipoprotein